MTEPGQGIEEERAQFHKQLNANLTAEIQKKEAELAERTGDVRPFLKSLDAGTTQEPQPVTPPTEKQANASENTLLGVMRTALRQMGRKQTA